MAPWKLPLIVAALAVPIVAAFYLGGGGVGLAAGALTAVALVGVAARQRPRGPIGAMPGEGGQRRVLLVATCPVEDPAAARRVAEAIRETGGGGEPEVRVLAPTPIGFLDRWASDVEPARRKAQEGLVAAVAALAKTGIAAEARVGDEDVVQAVEDQLQSFDATDVILVGDRSQDGIERKAGELSGRLRPEFLSLWLGGE